MKKAVVLFVFLFFSLSCGGCRQYKKDAPLVRADWTGKAKIIIIGTAGKSVSGEKDYLEVRFDFVPDDSSAPRDYLVKDVTDKDILLSYDNRSELHKNWVLKWGLKTGNEYRAVRHEDTQSGPASRVIFDVMLEPR